MKPFYIFVFIVITILFLSCKNVGKDSSLPNNTDTSAFFRQKLLCDIYPLLEQSPDSLRKVFGKPNKIIRNAKDCDDLPYCTEMHYKKDSITVLYQDNKALWFEFDSLQNYSWESLPVMFNLEDLSPDEERFNYAWFKNFPGIRQISFIKSESHYEMVDYAIVKVY